MNVDWARKLTSRKFWAAVVGFAAPLILAMGGSQEQATRITAIIMSGAAVIAYIVGEGLTDASATSAAKNANAANASNPSTANTINEETTHAAEMKRKGAPYEDMS